MTGAGAAGGGGGGVVGGSAPHAANDAKTTVHAPSVLKRIRAFYQYGGAGGKLDCNELLLASHIGRHPLTWCGSRGLQSPRAE